MFSSLMGRHRGLRLSTLRSQIGVTISAPCFDGVRDRPVVPPAALAAGEARVSLKSSL